MTDGDRLDRIERKINTIGRFVLFGFALLVIVTALLTKGYYDPLVFGYGNIVAAAIVAIALMFCFWARTPFRD